MKTMIAVILPYIDRYMSCVTYCVTDSTSCIQVTFFTWNAMYKFIKVWGKGMKRLEGEFTSFLTSA